MIKQKRLIGLVVGLFVTCITPENAVASGLTQMPVRRFMPLPPPDAAQAKRILSVPNAAASSGQFFPITHTRFPMPIRQDSAQTTSLTPAMPVRSTVPLRPATNVVPSLNKGLNNVVAHSEVPLPPAPAHIQKEAANMSKEQAQQILSIFPTVD